MKAEIQQSMLKYSKDEEINQFSSRVLKFIDPKFSDETEMQLAEAELYSFANRCELTASEMILALELATEGKLTTEPDSQGNSNKIKLFREINRLALGEVKSAYIRYKQENRLYEIGKEKLQEFLTPPEKKLTPEEVEKQRIESLIFEYRRLIKDGTIFNSLLFYDLIKKGGFEKIKLSFIENVLDKFISKKLKLGVKNEEGKEVKIFFINEVVLGYIRTQKLNEATESDWIEHWDSLKNKKS